MMRLRTAELTFLAGLLTILLVLAQTSCCCLQCPPPSSVTQSPDVACQKPSSERRDCQEFSPGGWGTANHKFLEGRGLEQMYFQSQAGGAVPFPPPAGMVLAAASECGNARLKVKVARCLPDNHGASACVVDVQTNNGICGASVPRVEDTKTHRGVIMVHGSWDKTGKWVDDPTKVTLSCDAGGGVDQALSADGAITACLRGHRYDPQTHSDEFLSCIRALRGDYCGDGTSHTNSGTDIDVFDKTLNQMTKSDCSDGRAFEASWTPAGAACIAHLRWAGVPNTTPICPNMAAAATNGALCVTPPVTPVVTTRSVSHACNGTDEIDTKPAETDPICLP